MRGRTRQRVAQRRDIDLIRLAKNALDKREECRVERHKVSCTGLREQVVRAPGTTARSANRTHFRNRNFTVERAAKGRNGVMG